MQILPDFDNQHYIGTHLMCIQALRLTVAVALTLMALLMAEFRLL